MRPAATTSASTTATPPRPMASFRSSAAPQPAPWCTTTPSSPTSRARPWTAASAPAAPPSVTASLPAPSRPAALPDRRSARHTPTTTISTPRLAGIPAGAGPARCEPIRGSRLRPRVHGRRLPGAGRGRPRPGRRRPRLLRPSGPRPAEPRRLPGTRGVAGHATGRFTGAGGPAGMRGAGDLDGRNGRTWRCGIRNSGIFCDSERHAPNTGWSHRLPGLPACRAHRLVSGVLVPR